MAEFESTAENIASLPLHEQFLGILKRVKKSSMLIAVLISMILIVVLESINFSCLVAEDTHVSSSTGHFAWAEAENQSEADVQEEKKNNSEQSGILKSLFMDHFGSEKEIGQEEETNAEKITAEDPLHIDSLSTICGFCGLLLLMISAVRFAFACKSEDLDALRSTTIGLMNAVLLLGMLFVLRSV